VLTSACLVDTFQNGNEWGGTWIQRSFSGKSWCHGMLVCFYIYKSF